MKTLGTILVILGELLAIPGNLFIKLGAHLNPSISIKIETTINKVTTTANTVINTANTVVGDVTADVNQVKTDVQTK